MANRATDFTYPASLTSTGGAVTCYITLKPELSSNRNSIYAAFGYGSSAGSYSLYYNKVGPGTYGITVPAWAFNRTNAYMTIQIDSYTSSGTFISGSFAHTVPLLRSGYTNNLFSCSIPDRTFPLETCSINIISPKDYSSGQYCEVTLNYNRAVGVQTIASGRQAGWYNFTTPELATNSSMTVRIVTKNSRGSVLGIIAHSINIKQPTSYTTSSTSSTSTYLAPPVVTAPSLTITEGAPIRFKGTSHDINDYMVIYAKRPCNVAEAVKNYDGEKGFYDATATQIKNKLLENAYNNSSYYILKDFNAQSTFISQDENTKNMFHIRTPNTENYKNINELYLMQWFQGVEPGDLVYIYIIEKGIKYTTTITMTTIHVPTIQGKTRTNVTRWQCRCCNGTSYTYWINRGSSGYSPYATIDLAQTRQFLELYSGVPMNATFVLNLDTSLNYAPELFVTSYSGRDGMTGSGTYLTPLHGGPTNSWRYSIPISLVKSFCDQGYSYMYIRSHWGKNTNYRVYFQTSSYIELSAHQQGTSGSYESKRVVTTSTTYTDARYTNIQNIPLSAMTPVAVIPPAVRPVELAIKENTSKSVTISYSNPLYGIKSQSAFGYNSLGSINIDVSKGDDKNDYSNLNAVEDANGNIVQMDPTLEINTLEERKTTYEKSMTIPSNVLTKIKNATSNLVYMDISLDSVDSNKLNFKDITNKNVKIQLMLSNNGENIARALDINASQIDLKQNKYKFNKVRFQRDLLMNNNYNTIHLLYNIDEYDDGKVFETKDWSMHSTGGKILQEIGWRKVGNGFGPCLFNIDSFPPARHALNYNKAQIRLRLENLNSTKPLFLPPTIKITHREMFINGANTTETILIPNENREIQPGEDIYYDIPQGIFDVDYEEILSFSMSPGNMYPVDTPEISFSNAIIEVVKINDLEDVVDKYATGFTAKIDFFEQKLESNSAFSFDPVECIDVIMCCYDKNKNLINKTANKFRDIYNGKELIYFTARKWHSFVNDKHINNPKYKRDYDMTFTVPSGTEYMYFIAFTYGDWLGNPSVYSMSNILTTNSIKQDITLEFVSPNPIRDTINKENVYANSEINNPDIQIKITGDVDTSMTISNNSLNAGFNLAKDAFDRTKWLASPIIYSNVQTYGYELPRFSSVDSYNKNNVTNAATPLNNNIEHYYRWATIYGKDMVWSPKHNSKNFKDNTVLLDSNYTVYRDEGDKFISNNSVPYIEIPKEISKYDRTKITIFLDSDFGKNI